MKLLRHKTIIISIIVMLFAALLIIIFVLYGRFSQSDSNAAIKEPCLHTGRCLVGVSHSDTIPGFRVKNGKEYFGFDVDVANYMTQRLGRGDAVIVQADRDSSLTDPEKPIHMYVSTVSMTDARLDKMMFVGPYMRTFQGVMVKNGSVIEQSSDLEGKTICAMENTTTKDALDAYNTTHAINVRTEATNEQCISGLHAGQYDAVSGDYITLQAAAHTDSTLKPLSQIRLSEGYEMYGIALPKTSTALCEEIKSYMKDFVREKWQVYFDNNLRDLGITYDPTDTTIPSLKPDAAMVSSYSCKQKAGI